MANTIMNALTIKNLRSHPLLLDKDKNPCMDFQKIIPMPASLNEKLAPASSNLEYAVVYYLTNRCRISLSCLSEEDDNLLKGVIASNHPARNRSLEILFAMAYDQSLTNLPNENDDFYLQGKRYVDNYVKHGSTNWYDWCCRHWGVKWNAFSSCALQSDPDTLYFETAWCPPYPILKALSQKYPRSVMGFFWADTEPDGDAGKAILKGGDCVQIEEYNGDEESAAGIRDACLAYRKEAEASVSHSTEVKS